MRLAAFGLLVLGALPLLIYPFIFLANVMSFAGTPTGNETLSQWLISRSFLFGSTIYPIIYLIFAVLAVIGILRNRGRSALTYSLVPLGYLVLLAGLFGIWRASETVFLGSQGGIFSSVQEAGSQIGECTQPILDAGDGYQTTGCGVIEAGSASGRIENAGQAHNWQVTAQNNHRMTLSIRNDGESCPFIHLLDENGLLIEAFEDVNSRRSCLEGMITTTNYFYDNPTTGQLYILRIFVPESPGRYWLEVE